MISVVCPTRGRPKQVAEMWRSAVTTATGAVELCVYVDRDDPLMIDTAANLTGVSDHRVAVMPGPRRCLSECWNEAYKMSRGDLLMHCGDDVVFRTSGWDKLIADAMPADGIGFVYGRDGYQDENLGTHGFVSRRWVEALGYFVPPYFSSDYNDLWLHEVAGLAGRRFYVPEVYIEHMHPVAGKGIWDQTHQDRLARHAADDPGALYERLAPERAADAEKLLAVCA